MSHTPPFFINHGKNSSAFFSLERPNSLVIFIHGLGGTATGTWDDFSFIIRTNNEFDDTDVIFYGYDSLKGQANNNAVQFYRFLTQVCENHPNNLGYNRNYLENNFSYDKIIIVAHSLGAVVTRRALLTAKGQNKIWLNKCHMILFAPAHRGARIQNLIIEGSPNIGKFLAALGMIKIPVIDDLRPESQTIINLINDSQNYLDDLDGDFTIANTVVWANNELIVHNESFCGDPVPIIIQNESHTSVCKPKDAHFLYPYEIVANIL